MGSDFAEDDEDNVASRGGVRVVFGLWRGGGKEGEEAGRAGVPGDELPSAQRVADRFRGRRRRPDVEHQGLQGRRRSAEPVRARRRRAAVRPGGEVADGELQPRQPLHALPPPRRRAPCFPGWLFLFIYKNN